MEAISVINALPSNKEEVSDFFERVKSNVLANGDNPFKFAVQLKALEVLIDRLRKDNEIQDWIIEEANKEGKGFEFLGNKIEVKEAGVKYDYSVCGDDEWNRLASELVAIGEEKKEREKFLKVLPIGGVADPETGNMIYPPMKTSSTSLFVTLK